MNETLKFESKITEVVKINPLVSRVLIKIAYAGLNRNNSYISKATFDAAEFSLPRTMILGEYNETVEDFRGHGGKLEITDDSIKWVNTTIPYGFIDIDSEISWQDVTEEDGTVRQYICATGYVWTGRYPELADIIENSKNHSMEIEIISGKQSEIDGIKCYEITEFIYSGLCILGDDVTPCFEGSSISAYSLDKDKFKSQFNQMVAELKFSLSEPYSVVRTVVENNPVEKWVCPHCNDYIGEKELYFNEEKWYHRPCYDKGEIHFTNNSLQQIERIISVVAEVLTEGGNNEVPEDILALLAKYSLTESDLLEKEITYTDFSLEELEVKINETFQKEEIVEPEVTPTEFSWSAEQLEDELRRIVRQEKEEDSWGYECSKYYYVDHLPEEKIVIVYSYEDSTYLGFSYSVSGDVVSTNTEDKARYKSEWAKMNVNPESTESGEFNFVPKEVLEYKLKVKEAENQKQFDIEKETLVNESQANLEKVQSDFAELQQKYAELEAKANAYESDLTAKAIQERSDAETEIFESFSVELTEDEMKDVKEKASQMSLEDITEKLFSIAGRKKVKFSLKDVKDKPIGFQIPNEEKKSSGKSYDDLFDKYSKKD